MSSSCLANCAPMMSSTAALPQKSTRAAPRALSRSRSRGSAAYTRQSLSWPRRVRSWQKMRRSASAW
eukprot:5088326-Pyramimonas_sp.AAC.1